MTPAILRMWFELVSRNDIQATEDRQRPTLWQPEKMSLTLHYLTRQTNVIDFMVEFCFAQISVNLLVWIGDSDLGLSVAHANVLS